MVLYLALTLANAEVAGSRNFGCSSEMANTCPKEQELRSGTGAILDLRCSGGYLAGEMSSRHHVTHSGHPPVPLTKIAIRAKPRGADSLIPSLNSYYAAMLAAHGPQHWWPGRTRFEVIVGAILTQNTSWSNVKRAIDSLRREHLLTVWSIDSIPSARLERIIRPSGYFRQKTRTLKAFVRFLRTEYAGLLTQMFRTPTLTLRRQLLAVRGIGPETADCILLYAGKQPLFVVDAYARRILERHGHTNSKAKYEEIRAIFERSIPADAAVYNEFHALIVRTGKHFCHKSVPHCSECPLQPFLPRLPGRPS
jgi:endonuclease III related protein